MFWGAPRIRTITTCFCVIALLLLFPLYSGFLSPLWHYSTNGLIHSGWAFIIEIRYNSSVLKLFFTTLEAFLFEIVFLGTSASAPSVHRGLSSQVIIHDEFRFLIDCGEGTQRQILQSGLGFKRLNRVLITHGHLDHILGLAGLLSTFMRWETIDRLEIYGGQWALDRIYDLIYGIVLRGAKPPMDLQLPQVKAGTIFDEDDFTFTAFPVWHRGPDCFGYLFEEKTRRPFLPEKADELIIPPGPWRRDLVSGHTITLPDGRLIHPDQVLGEERPGTRMAHVGDVGRTDELIQVVHDVDALIIEATYMHEAAG